MNYENAFQRPSFVQRIFSLTSRNPKQLTCDKECLNCRQKLQKNNMSSISYQMIIDYHKKFNSNVVDFDSNDPNQQKERNLQNVEEFTVNQNQDQRLKHKLKNEDQIKRIPQSIEDQLRFDSYMNFYKQQEKSEFHRIPQIFRNIYLDLTYEKYQKQIENIEFGRKTIDVCNDCYMQYLGELRIAGKKRILYHNNKDAIYQIKKRFKEYNETYQFQQ